MNERIHSVSDGNFEAEVLKSPLPVLVDYWADWCGPCRALAPVLDDISTDYEGRLKVAKIDIDKNPQTPANYGIRNIPTLMLFKDGDLVATQVGLLSKTQLTSFIDSHI
ncbi:MAG: thioredoxin [Betaproteobacteria bacterium]|nr:thioredoxin [Betaproteobacteria bacterium]MCL2162658.1 thioredoxin [Betaproteobacteria bacterium]MCL2162671.1 thioredoxin [Betaproteobacteria bacterium]